jgi:hypothetical protein
MPKKEMPDDVQADLLWLEAKQVIRGIPSTFFPDLTFLKARGIRMMGYEQFKIKFMEGVKDEQ